jgi:hypothetical protein
VNSLFYIRVGYRDFGVEGSTRNPKVASSNFGGPRPGIVGAWTDVIEFAEHEAIGGLDQPTFR